MRYEIISVVYLGKSYAILIRDNNKEREFVLNSSKLNSFNPELRLFVKARMYFIRSGVYQLRSIIDRKHEVE